MSATGRTAAAPARGPRFRTLGLRSRYELLFVALLLALSAGAWLLSNRLGTPHMRTGILTGAGGEQTATGMGYAGHASIGMSSAGALLPSLWVFALFFGMWTVMMTAMMLPSTVPVIVGAGRLVGAGNGSAWSPYAMTGGYLFVWALSAVGAYGVFSGFQAISPAGGSVAARAGAVVLIVAGAFQFTRFKQVCLRHCRSPLAILAHYGPTILATRTGALRIGLRHGAYCLGCCWALMLVLLAAGMMSLVWMGVIAATVLLEKVSPPGESLSRALGVALIGVGVLALLLPGVVPSLA